MFVENSKALEARARRAAARAGYVACKSRWRRDSLDNLGGFMLIDPSTNAPVRGFRYDLDAQDVIGFCKE